MAEQGHLGRGEDGEASLPSGSPADDAPADGALWDDWTTPPRIAPMPVLHLEGFDGPMDQLLDLVERKRIDFARMSPLAIVDQLDAALAHLARHLDLLSFVPAIPETPERHAQVRAAIAGTLLASLEMAREGEASLDQLMFADPITVRPGQMAVANSAAHSVPAPAGGEDDPHRPGRTAVSL